MLCLYFVSSSVTGVNSEGDLFDVGRVSDYDIALISPELMQKARDLNVKLKTAADPSSYTRTFVLSDDDLRQLGFYELPDELSRQAGRPCRLHDL